MTSNKEEIIVVGEYRLYPWEQDSQFYNFIKKITVKLMISHIGIYVDHISNKDFKVNEHCRWNVYFSGSIEFLEKIWNNTYSAKSYRYCEIEEVKNNIDKFLIRTLKLLPFM